MRCCVACMTLSIAKTHYGMLSRVTTRELARAEVARGALRIVAAGGAGLATEQVVRVLLEMARAGMAREADALAALLSAPGVRKAPQVPPVRGAPCGAASTGIASFLQASPLFELCVRTALRPLVRMPCGRTRCWSRRQGCQLLHEDVNDEELMVPDHSCRSLLLPLPLRRTPPQCSRRCSPQVQYACSTMRCAAICCSNRHACIAAPPHLAMQKDTGGQY